jgi:biopolymer transport protein ExbB
MLALACYSVLLHLLMNYKLAKPWLTSAQGWLQTLPAMLSALPLLGLLGTIVGLLQTFTQMSQGSMDIHQLLSSGIADAMITTEIGLLMVIPGWIMLAILQRKWQRTVLVYAQ